MNARPIVMCLSAALVLGMSAAGHAESRDRARKGKTYIWTFAADTLGQSPAGSRSYGGAWTVVLDSAMASQAGVSGDSSGTPDSATAAPRFLRQSEADDGITYHYLQFPKPKLQNLAASVRFRILSGEIDPTAGIAFHLDAKGRNGYVVRVSGAKGEVIAHYLLYGKRRDIRIAAVEPPEPGAWHTLGLRKEGSVLEVTYDGVSVLRIRDERYSEGTVGLWTEDDTVVDFSDFTVRSL